MLKRQGAMRLQEKWKNVTNFIALPIVSKTKIIGGQLWKGWVFLCYSCCGFYDEAFSSQVVS
jgi:hypothetical protein